MRKLLIGGAWKNAALAGSTLVGIAFLIWLFTLGEVRIPFLSADKYSLSFVVNDVDNLVNLGDVQTAGVKVGKVRGVTNEGGRARVDIDLDEEFAPLHEGVTVRVGAKSLVGESVVDLVDGSGKELEPGTVIPQTQVRPPVQLREVLASLDPKTRESLGGAVRALGEGTRGTAGDTSTLMSGLGDLGRHGYTVLDAVSAQSKDLTALASQASDALNALNTGEGRIGNLVDNANQLVSATDGQKKPLADTMRTMPGVLSSARTAVVKAGSLGQSLSPVAADLKAAAPPLSDALKQLPATTSDIRGLLPALDTTLQRAPATLGRVPAVGGDVRGLVPGARTVVSNLNPMAGYLRPYARDLTAFITNFSAMIGHTDEAGLHYARLQPTINEGVPKLPVKLPDMLSYKNPYPAPGGSAKPGPGNPQFPRLHPEPK